MTDIKHITSFIVERWMRLFASWWGGVRCRISFFMILALFLVAALVGTFFFFEGKNAIDAEIRSRALFVARELSALTVDDIITANRLEIYKKMAPVYLADSEASSGSGLLYLSVYNHHGELLVGSNTREAFFDAQSYFYTRSSGPAPVRDVIPLDREVMLHGTEPVFFLKESGIYDLLLPVMAGSDRIGFIRVGISGQWYSTKFSGFVKRAGITLFAIVLVGMVFSQIIATGITRPILNLNDSAEKLSQQNWDAPIPVNGSDEISKLARTFNQMAHALQEREASLSRGNRDLFILHTAGLDLMESLDLQALLVKIAARAEDLVRADTTALVTMNISERRLKYEEVIGGKARLLKDREMPLEAGGIYNWLASYGSPLLIADAQTDFRLDSELMKKLGIRSIMSVPLWSSNTLTGLLTVINKKGGASFDRQDLRLFTVYSNLAGAALQNASLYTDLNGKMNELKNTQRQLVHSTKMAAIGELAANVAHEINNPLTSVLGYTTHLLKTLDLPESPRRMLGMMEQETLRVRKIIRNLLDFSRQKNSRMQSGELASPLKETVALIRGMAEAASVRLSEKYPDFPVMVSMDHDELKQVFINIIYNALHAMPHGGTFRISFAGAREEEACIEFADTGVGIRPEHVGRIFEPFFSTKEDGDGTGLGLSISYRIVQNHGGRIEVESEVGKGTIFRVYLPLQKNSATMHKS